METPTYPRTINGVRVVDGRHQHPDAEAAMNYYVSSCTGNEIVVACEPGRAGERVARAFESESFFPPKGHTFMSRGKPEVMVHFLREDGWTELAEAIEDSVARNPPEAVVVLHCHGDFWGLLHYARPLPPGLLETEAVH